MYDNHFDEITIEAGNTVHCWKEDYPDAQLVVSGQRIYVVLLDGRVSLTDLVHAYTSNRDRGR